MEKKGYEMIPYVEVQDIPENGIYGFLDSPRYSSGYAALHNCLSFMPETHMLKPYYDRVMSTYSFMIVMLNKMQLDHKILMKNKNLSEHESANSPNHNINWERNNELIDSLVFKGYTAKYKPSAITGKDRLFYDRSEPYTKKVDYHNAFKPSKNVQTPYAYIVPKAYEKVIERLENNGTIISKLNENKLLDVEMYAIEDYKSKKSPYEGHYLHEKGVVNKRILKKEFRKGDYIIEVNQPSSRYIVECLEPESVDSYFAWNFFDGVLMRKENFSPYLFEDTAANLLENDKDLLKLFEKEKMEDKAFKDDPKAQLEFIYQYSTHAEEGYNIYPVARLMWRCCMNIL